MKQIAFIITMFLLACMFVVFAAAKSYGGSVTATYNLQSPIKLTEKVSIFTGYVDAWYTTGGLEWKSLRAKFKNLWAVVFEVPPRRGDETTILIVRYDRDSEKVLAYDATTGAELPNNTQITETFFRAIGEN